MQILRFLKQALTRLSDGPAGFLLSIHYWEFYQSSCWNPLVPFYLSPKSATANYKADPVQILFLVQILKMW